jgi:hypothetical protein
LQGIEKEGGTALKAKWWIITSAFLLILISGMLLFGCGKPEQKEISGIRIVSGSFKENYTLDETVNLSGAYIVATYVDNTTERIKIQADWVKGLDVSTTGSKTLSVTYRGKQATFLYNVVYHMTITTPVRLISERADDGENKVIVLSLRDTERMPVYAVKFEISLTDLTYVRKIDNMPDGWAAASHPEGNVLTFLFYSQNGNSPIDSTRALTKLYLQGSAGGIVFIQTVITDGTEDRKAPDLTITI